MSSLSYFALGMDAEVNIFDQNKPINASKEIPFAKYGEGGSLASDGTQLEFHVHPHPCREEALRAIKYAIMDARKASRGRAIKLASATRFSKAEIDAGDERSKQFLCNPSSNIYGVQGTMPEEGSGWRFAGGHMAVSFYGRATNAMIKNMIKWADIVVSLPLVVLDRADKARSLRRRQHYGLPGEYRVTHKKVEGSYDYWDSKKNETTILEYRTPSNSWLFHPMLAAYCYGAFRHCLSLADVEPPVKDSEVIHAIMTHDRDKALDIWKRCRPTIIANPNTAAVSYSNPLDERWIGNIEALMNRPSLLGLPKLFKSRQPDFKAWANYGGGGFEQTFAINYLKKNLDWDAYEDNGDPDPYYDDYDDDYGDDEW